MKPSKTGDRVVESTQAAKQVAEIEQGARMPRIEDEDTTEACFGLAGPTRSGLQLSQRELGLGFARFSSEQVSEVCLEDGVGLRRTHQQLEILESLGVIRSKGEGTAIGVSRIGEATLVAQRVGQVVVIGGGVGTDCEGALDQRDCALRIALRMNQDAQHVEQGRMVGEKVKERFVDGTRLV